MTDTQNAEADLNNPLHRAIELYIGGALRVDVSHKQRIKMGPLSQRLHDAAKAGGINLLFEAHVANMRSKINSQFSTLEKNFGLRKKPNRDHAHDYWFEPTAEVFARCKDIACQTNPHMTPAADYPMGVL
jgi:hypothetical protein